MPIPALVGGVLPPGRHPCTLAEIEAAFVTDAAFATSSSRQALWQQHWTTAVTLLTGAVTVYEAWISGSFVTDKLNPRDIDVVFVVSEEDRASRSTADQQVVEAFNLRQRDPITGRLLPLHGLLVDSYVLGWAPYHQPPGTLRTPEYVSYTADRGYWDDFWCRRRVTAKKAPPTREDAFPQRGYLEVSLNAYA